MENMLSKRIMINIKDLNMEDLYEEYRKIIEETCTI